MHAAPPERSVAPPERRRADGVFEGGGVKGLAFAGAVAAAEEAGVEEWVNVAGTSAGAIVSALLAARYDAAGLKRVLEQTDYRRFADYGFGGKWLGGLRNALRSRGLVKGEYFKRWLAERFAESALGRPDPTFGDVERRDRPADVPDDEWERARFRLRVIASDVTAGRMLVLPDDIVHYTEAPGAPAFRPESFPLVDAVRMSMSFPYFFNPVTLYRDGKPHLIVDGGLLSNFPVWLFDSPNPPRRWTYGFRLHEGEGEERPPYHPVPRRLWPYHLGKAMFFSATEAWDQRMTGVTRARTVSIPTGTVRTLAFELSDPQRDQLYESGLGHARRFFADFARRETYLNTRGQRAAGPAAVGAGAAVVTQPA